MSSGNEVRCLAFTEEGKENLTLVYELAEERGIKCVWVTQEEAESIVEPQKEVVYAIDPIEGSEEIEMIVDNLVKLKYPILGPQCLLTALKHGIRLQNDMKYPVYTLTMYGTQICFSNILSGEREKLVRLVELMGGKVTRPLNGGVTHLVVGEVGSVKYFTAADNNIKIVVKDWIHHLWKVGISKYVCAKDGKWEEFLCPVFLGCCVCMTGFGTAEKSKVQKLIVKFGGDYSGAMKLNYTTHLIVNKPEGQKYGMAAKFGVKVVNLNWVYDSIEKGFCQDNIKYPVKPLENAPKPELHQSTPEKSARFMSMADVSSIDPSTINETVASAMNDTSVMSMLGTVGKLPNRLLSFSINQDYSDILDGIHVFITGFSFQEEEKIGKVLSLAGAIKHAQLTSIIERVIVGDPSRVSVATKNEILAASSENPDLHVVGQNWVLDSLSKGKCLPEKDYWQSSILPSDYEDTRSRIISEDQETTVFDEIPTVKKNDGPRPSVADNDGSVLGLLLPEDNDDITMLSQYQANVKGNDYGNGHDISETRVDRENDSTRYGHEDMEETCQEGDETTAMQSTTAVESEMTVEGCFQDKTFYILGFDATEIQDLVKDVESYGGIVLPGNSKKISDFVVVPLAGWPIDKTANEVVTVFWVKYSIELGRIVDPSGHPLCIPFSVVPHSLPLQGCVACLSQYKYSERVYLARLIIELGGIVQDIVARRELNDLKQTTHLVIREPGGDKYTGCKNWGIPVVSENWVYECARRSKKLDEKDFIVGEQKESKTERLPIRINKPEIPNLCREVKHASCTSSWGTEFPPIPRQPSVVNKIRERLEAKHDQNKRALEEAIKNKETPVGIRYKRMQLETPSRFMKKGGTPGNVSFDLTEVFKLLQTPVEQQKKVHDEMRKNPETPMSEIISRCLDGGIANIPDHLIQNLDEKLVEQDPDDRAGISPPQKENISIDENQFTNQTKEQVSNIFEKLVISLATKLHKNYSELGKIITVHGGEFRWTYDNACTHFLFQGRLNDKNKEFCTAKKDGKIIVTPYWIEACVLAESRLDESMFPHVYDPNKSIQVSTQKSQRTRRSTQQKTRMSTRSSNSGTSSTSENDETPKRRTKIHAEQPEDSQEGRDLLKKKLENIMADTSVARAPQVHRLSCGRPSFLSPAQRRVSTVTLGENFAAGNTELSQDVQVSWDDPTGREEMLRLMNKDDSDINVSTLNVAVEDEVREDVEEEKNPSEMFFLMSSVSANDKAKYAGIITVLGAEFLDSNCFDFRGTHLLVSKPGRSEKYLSALAYGKYILNPSYLLECESEGKFISEAKYEFGNPENSGTERLLQNPEVLQSLIPLAAYRWRTKLDQVKKETGVEKGAFTGWKVVLLVNERQQKGFERLLKCGQAEIVESQNIFQLGKARNITHAFIDQERTKNIDVTFVEDLVLRMGIHVCDPTFIGDYLLKDPQPKPNDYYIPQASTILERSVEDPGESEAKRRKTD